MTTAASINTGNTMGVLERLRQNWKLCLALVLTVTSAAVITAELLGQDSSRARPQQVYYTTDDGTTLFGDSETLLPPFDHDGQQAVRAHVFKRDGKQVVGYLERYSPEAHRILSVVTEAAKNAHPGDKPPKELELAEGAERGGREVKRPGDKNWVSIQRPASVAITHPRSFDGGPNPVEFSP